MATEHRILMCRRSVLGVLSGRKTETRRLKEPPWQPGDLLWMGEAWRTMDDWDTLSPREMLCDAEYAGMLPIRYEADEIGQRPSLCDGRTRPGMFLPKALARPLRLKVLDVHSEQLQSISEASALAEGLEPREEYWSNPSNPCVYYVLPGEPRANPKATYSYPIDAYRAWWGELRPKPGQRWEDNPRVWVTQWEIVNG